MTFRRAGNISATKDWTYMPKVEIYTTPFCPYCSRAKALLETKGVDFQEYDVSMAHV